MFKLLLLILNVSFIVNFLTYPETFHSRPLPKSSSIPKSKNRDCVNSNTWQRANSKSVSVQHEI
jgi:hypothetical protein